MQTASCRGTPTPRTMFGGVVLATMTADIELEKGVALRIATASGRRPLCGEILAAVMAVGMKAGAVKDVFEL